MRLVAPEFIAAQRAAGWPDVHPEDYCHRCGTRNPVWFTDQQTWATATAAWATQTGREGICCPWCLAEMHEHATGRAAVWAFVPESVLAERDALTETTLRLRSEALGRVVAERDRVRSEVEKCQRLVREGLLTPEEAFHVIGNVIAGYTTAALAGESDG